MHDEQTAPHNRIYLLNGDDVQNIGTREAQIGLFGRPNRLIYSTFKKVKCRIKMAALDAAFTDRNYY